jgi:hypothetical protein
MPTFTGRHSASVALRLAPEAAAAAFADLGRQVACHPELASAERIDATTLRLRMKEMSHGPVAFAGNYVLSFVHTGATVRWQSGRDSNIGVRGEAVFSAAPGGGSRLAFTEEVSLDLPVTRIVAGVVRPVAEHMIGRGMRGFLERMVAELERLG